VNSMRARLLLVLLVTTGAVWFSAATWIYFGTRAQVEQVLDARLREAARMVSSMVTDDRVQLASAAEAVSLPDFVDAPPGYEKQLSCQIWSMSGSLVGRSESAPGKRLADAGEGFSVTEIGGETWRVFTVANDARGVQVMVGDNMRMRERLVNDVMMGTLLPMSLFLPLGALLIWFSVRRGLAPLDAMAETLGRRHDSDLRPLGVDPMPTELRPVLHAINGLFSRVATARDREKSFTAFAAHELKTPLAGLKTQAQIALMTTDEETRSRALAQIAGSVDRSARMVRQLLDLAAADAASAEGDAHADVAKVLEDAVTAVSPVAVLKDSRICVTGAITGAISCDRALATTAVRNLLENAVVHSPSGSNVRLNVSAESGRMIISVSDDGPGMTEAEILASTDRFVRGRASSGSGLGLAIVDAVAKRSSGSLSVANGPEGGLTVTLTLLSQGQESPKGESCRRL